MFSSGFFRKVIPVIVFFSSLFLFSCHREKKTDIENNSKVGEAPQGSDIDELSKQIRENPENLELYFKRAQLCLRSKKLEQAMNDMNYVLARDSSKTAYYMTMADICFATLNIPKAEESFQKAISLDKQNIDAHLKLAELYLYMKKYDESIKSANEALRIDPHRAKAYFIKGFVFKENHDTAKAVSSFETCIEQEPQNYDAFIQLGNIYAAHKDKLAEQYYSSALRLKPNSTEALYDRGLYYQESNEVEKAEADYKALLKIDPQYKNAYFNLGYIELKFKKNYQEAINQFTLAINLDKYYAEGFYNRGYCYEQMGNIKSASADYHAALSIFPTYKIAIAALKRIGG